MTAITCIHLSFIWSLSLLIVRLQLLRAVIYHFIYITLL